MPRARKPGQQGQPNGQQPIRVATGGAYGDAQASHDAQKVMPLAQGAGVPSPPPPSTMDQAVQEAAPVSFDMGGLAADTAYPNEPVTAGLPSGPGPGPEALAMNRGRGRTSSTLDLIASVTGDPEMAALAQKARSQGL